MKAFPRALARNSFPSISHRHDCGGFSLVEIVLALGVLVFALASIFGMVPLALTTLRASIDATAKTHIMQTLVNDAQLSERGALEKETYYFDESGQLVPNENSDWIYKVKTNLSPLSISDSSSVVEIPGETFLVGIQSRSSPPLDDSGKLISDWNLDNPAQLPSEVSLQTAVLLR